MPPPWEGLRPLVTTAAALISAAVVLLFAWRKRDDLSLPGGGRGAAVWRTVPLVTAVLAASILIRFDHCSYIRTLLSYAGKAVIVCVIALLLHWLLVKYVHTPRSTLTSVLTDASTILLYFAWNVCGTLALTSIAVAFLNDQSARLQHRELQLLVNGSLVSAEVPLYTKPGLPTHFSFRHAGCNNTVRWSALPSDLGSIEYGTYIAPDTVSRVRRVEIVAEAADRDWERATANLIIDSEVPGITRTTTPSEDSGGHMGVFDVMVITDERSWVCRSTAVIDGNVPGPSLIDSLVRVRAFDPYRYLIAVGTASHEGQRQVEDARADQRAITLGTWLERGVSSNTPRAEVRRINLGQYTSNTSETYRSCDESRSERPLVIIGVVTNDESLDLASGLRNVFEIRRREAFFANILDHYPRAWTVEEIPR